MSYPLGRWVARHALALYVLILAGAFAIGTITQHAFAAGARVRAPVHVNVHVIEHGYDGLTSHNGTATLWSYSAGTMQLEFFDNGAGIFRAGFEALGHPPAQAIP